MKKILLSILFFIFLSISAFAGEIDKLISNSDFELKSIVSVYVEDEKDGSILYKKNESKLLNPASTLKTLTFGASYIVLGEGFEFKTALYKDKDNNLYLRLSGDAMLSSGDLSELFCELKTKIDTSKIKNIYIDDSIFDKTPYPKSWMEDDIWPNQRAITPYVIDNNTTKIAINRSSLATKVDVIQNDEYKIPIINELKLGDSQNIEILKQYGENSSIVNFKGTVVKDEILTLPVLSPELNFKIKVLKAINKNDIKYFNKLQIKKTPDSACEIASVSHTIEQISKSILLNSDNFASEIVFRAAAAKYLNYQKSAGLDDAINMFYNIFNVTDEDIVIADSSGVSRYNLVSAEFMVKALRRLFLETKIKSLMASANQGTLTDRLIFLENNLKAKTGTLSAMSSIAGGLTTKEGRDVVFAIIIQNSPKRKAILKNFENSLIGLIYKKY